MENNILLLLTMLFLHIVDDYYLQGILASLKQRKWWRENSPNSIYKHDYIMALIMHSFSWSFVVMLPLTIITYMSNAGVFSLVILMLSNTITHGLVDNAKANWMDINLIQDQVIHVGQILLTWLLFI